jgi:5'(3')-deoxyribonucleotidase
MSMHHDVYDTAYNQIQQYVPTHLQQMYNVIAHNLIHLQQVYNVTAHNQTQTYVLIHLQQVYIATSNSRVTLHKKIHTS